MYLADYHVHSSCSPDGHVTMADMAAEGIRRGLNEICFTDHVDTIQWGTTHLRTDTFDWAAVEKQYADAVARYGDRIRLKLGAELGEAYLGFDCAEKQMAGAPELDFVIGSVHMTRDENGWFDLFYIDGDRDDDYYHSVIDAYLEEERKLAQWGQFSVLGHLTLPVRCINEMRHKNLSFRPHMAQVEEILRTAITKGIGIECNTNRGNTPLPDADILKLYRSLGGEIITLGSDAHTTQHLGCVIQARQELLRSCGFRYFTTFDRMKPSFQAL